MKKFIPILLSAVFALGLATAPAFAAEGEVRVPQYNVPKVKVPDAPEPVLNLEKERKGFARIIKPSHIYKYHYYPEKQIYFDDAKKRWFVQQDGKWLSRETEPKELNSKASWSVIIEMGNDRPFERHDEVRRHFPKTRESSAYHDGFEDGFEVGYRDAYAEGFRAAFERGYRDGYKEGFRDGDRSDDGKGRHNPGEDRGRKEGWDKR